MSGAALVTLGSVTIGSVTIGSVTIGIGGVGLAVNGDAINGDTVTKFPTPAAGGFLVALTVFPLPYKNFPGPSAGNDRRVSAMLG